jgi:acetoin utilization protein AcuC
MAGVLGRYQMTGKAAFVYSPEYQRYQFNNKEHPFNPMRLKITYDLLLRTGLLTQQDLVQPRIATEAELAMVHSQEYINAVCKASDGFEHEDLSQFELGTEDNPIFSGMHSAASLIVGGTLTAVDLVMENKVKHAVNIAGGWHHAHGNRASGFCIYNDPAVAIAYLRKKYNIRVLYIDIDAHHGDGVQNIFYDDPDVLVISLHESGHYLFPGTGDIYEQGSGYGYGYTINLPVEPFTEDESFISVFEGAVVPNARAFGPHIIISQNGCDGHYLDPLTHLSLTMKGYSKIFELIHWLAEQLCDGKLVALGGGGYNVWQVVPRVWAMLWSQITERELNKNMPLDWIKKWEPISGKKLPRSIFDPPDLVPQIPRRDEINEKNQIIVNRVMKQSVLLF